MEVFYLITYFVLSFPSCTLIYPISLLTSLDVLFSFFYIPLHTILLLQLFVRYDAINSHFLLDFSNLYVFLPMPSFILILLKIFLITFFYHISNFFLSCPVILHSFLLHFTGLYSFTCVNLRYSKHIFCL